MTKHTPGPWVIRQTQDYGSSVEAVGGCGVGVAWCGANATAGERGAYVIGRREAQANARLIAAAPDLLRILKSIVNDHMLYTVQVEAKKLIEAVEGETKSRTRARTVRKSRSARG